MPGDDIFIETLQAMIGELKADLIRAEKSREEYALMKVRDWVKERLIPSAYRIAELEDALRAIMKEPYGCPFCDSGVLRKYPQVMKDAFPGYFDDHKEHHSECKYEQARLVLINTVFSSKEVPLCDGIEAPRRLKGVYILGVPADPDAEGREAK